LRIADLVSFAILYYKLNYIYNIFFYLIIWLFLLGDEDDFILQEELDTDMVNMMEIDNLRRAIEVQNIPFVQVPLNLLLPPNSNMCVVCKDLERTHALIPCGHKSLCGNCAELLHPKRCPFYEFLFS